MLKYHLVSNNILANEQFGFHDNVSTDSAIFKHIQSIFNAWNNKECITCLFCDLTKVFDSVNYELLILKLEFYVVKGCILKWLKSILGFLRDLCWAHYCLTCILMIFHAS